MSDHKHKWYVDQPYESEINEDDKCWADLALICIHDDGCMTLATVMVDIDYNKIKVMKDE